MPLTLVQPDNRHNIHHAHATPRPTVDGMQIPRQKRVTSFRYLTRRVVDIWAVSRRRYSTSTSKSNHRPLTMLLADMKCHKNMFACLKAAYDAGINFSTARSSMRVGESERAVGRGIEYFGWRRCDVVVSTKIYWGTHNSNLPAPRNRINNVGVSRKHLIDGTEASLKRLQLSSLDILYAHRPCIQLSDQHGPNDVLGNFGVARFRDRGGMGCSRSSGANKYCSRTTGYSLLRREKVEEKFKSARLYERCGLGLAALSPLAGGLLTGKYIDGGHCGEGGYGRGYFVDGVGSGERLGVECYYRGESAERI